MLLHEHTNIDLPYSRDLMELLPNGEREIPLLSIGNRESLEDKLQVYLTPTHPRVGPHNHMEP